MNDHIEAVSLELAKMANLMTALELATDCMTCADDESSRRQRDATVGLVDVMRVQLDRTRDVLDGRIALSEE